MPDDRVVGDDRIVSLGFWNPTLPTLARTENDGDYHSIECEFENIFEKWVRARLNIPRVKDFGSPRMVNRSIATTIRTPYSVHAEWRNLAGLSYGKSMGWHKDSPGMGDDTLVMALWSSNNPTWCRRNSGRKIYQAQPNEVVLVKNEDFRHRTPRLTLSEAESRWFGRCFLHPPATINPSEDVQIWKVR